MEFTKRDKTEGHTMKTASEICARNDGIEEAACICEQTDASSDGIDCWDWHSKDYAKAIRALKNKEGKLTAAPDGVIAFCRAVVERVDRDKKINGFRYPGIQSTIDELRTKLEDIVREPDKYISEAVRDARHDLDVFEGATAPDKTVRCPKCDTLGWCVMCNVNKKEGA